MGIKIASWNIDWIISPKEDIIKENKDKLKIAKHLAKNYEYDVIALLEADSDKNVQLKIEGYKKFYCSRNFKNEKYNWNGILLYVKECYSPCACEKVLDEFENNKSSCFLPLIITINDEIFHCLFVWTLQSQKEWEKGGQAPYGFNRFNDILTDDKFEKTQEFINGRKQNVIVIGDFNVVSNYKEDLAHTTRIRFWKKLNKMMESYDLHWIENTKGTFVDNLINDHCFVSKNLSDLTTLNVGEKSYGGVESDHNLICLTINNQP